MAAIPQQPPPWESVCESHHRLPEILKNLDTQALFWHNNPIDYAVDVGGPWRLYTRRELTPESGRILGVVAHRSGQSGALLLALNGELLQANGACVQVLPHQPALRDLCRASTYAKLEAMHTKKMRDNLPYMQAMVGVIVDGMRYSEASRLCAHPSLNHVRIYQAHKKFLKHHGLPPHA